MAHPFGDGVQQQRSARDRLSVTIRLGQAREDVPPIIKQRHQAGRRTTARQVMRDEAAPAPLVLQLVENILSVAAVAVELAKAFQGLAERRGENLIFPHLLARADVEEGEPGRSILVHRGRRQRASRAPPQYDDAPLSAPASQSNLGLLGLPTLARIDPIALPRKTLDRAF